MFLFVNFGFFACGVVPSFLPNRTHANTHAHSTFISVAFVRCQFINWEAVSHDTFCRHILTRRVHDIRWFAMATVATATPSGANWSHLDGAVFFFFFGSSSFICFFRPARNYINFSFLMTLGDVSLMSTMMISSNYLGVLLVLVLVHARCILLHRHCSNKSIHLQC